MYKQNLNTPGDILNRIISLLEEDFPERTILTNFKSSADSVPVYSWEGAGSEKGGSSEHIKYEKIVFLPPQNDLSTLVSVGNKRTSYNGGIGLLLPGGFCYFPVDNAYSVLLREEVPEDLAQKIIEFYDVNVEGKENELKNDYHFKFAMKDLLKPGTRSFRGIDLFAYGKKFDERLEGFYVKRFGNHVNLLSRNLGKVSLAEEWMYCFTEDYGEKMARALAENIKGKDDTLASEIFLNLVLSKRDIFKLNEWDIKKVVSQLERTK